MRFLFWNTKKNVKINFVIKQLVRENNIHIVILAEYNADINELLSELKLVEYVTIGCNRINILGKIPHPCVQPSSQSKYASFQIINGKIILCCVHLPGKIYCNSEVYLEKAINQINYDIDMLESQIGLENTVVVGDFNLNPYESALIRLNWFRSLPICEETKYAEKKDNFESKPFYNPMWNFFGDFKFPYGTYYYKGKGDGENIFWHIFDQVFIRPAMRANFVEDSLKIVTETSKISLLDEQNHPRKDISDHLPIMFEIEEI
ncbi:hypothetical protein [uncultured Bacteroides sp.]|uniref:hypothetical protein n=1 Tax=uncultured Bacteroides sp. TaxID=162156 RepID=UPI002624E135|nr:hypothetical protein [uncultured Bacteroides sp.]